eukprot:7581954-Ditylum_brightwellii.AAC.1
MAGRTDTILYTLQMPKAFIDRVMYIALCKWLGMGAVLCFTETAENVDLEEEKLQEHITMKLL